MPKGVGPFCFEIDLESARVASGFADPYLRFKARLSRQVARAPLTTPPFPMPAGLPLKRFVALLKSAAAPRYKGGGEPGMLRLCY